MQDLIKPIAAECKHAAKSTKEFKERILKLEKFDSDQYEVIGLDCVQLFTSINIDRVLKHILDIIYVDPTKYVPETSKLIKINKELVNRPVEPPSRDKLKKFFKSVLCDFNSFEALNGFFRQIEGVFMGGKLSPAIANIFCHMFEKQIIEEQINNGTILAYYRYVDDI